MSEMNRTPEAAAEQDLSEVLRVRRDKLKELQQAGKDPFQITTAEVTGHSKTLIDNFDTTENETYCLAGRLMSWRDMGKASFMDLQDSEGKIQLYVRIDDVGEEVYKGLKYFDIGDIIWVKGFVFRTRRGEISIHVKEMKLLSKSLNPLPEKWHGLKDTDLRYRQRYVDLIVNPEVKQTFVMRSKIISAIRRFLEDKGFLEVETPTLHTIQGGASARPFITHHNALDMDLYLRIALELHLKRLIVGGFDRVFEIGRVFRNEGIDVRHNPEFTLLELYQAYTDYNGMMDLTEELIKYCAKQVCGKDVITYGDVEIDMNKPFARLTMADAVKQYTGIDWAEISTLEQARAAAESKGLKPEKHFLKGDILNMLFEEFVEDKLIQPTFIMGHPVEISPLAKKNPADPQYTERFELFAVGREHANAFSELNDPIDQRQRFERQAELKAAGDEEATPLDEDFINALSYGMPPTGGLGIGIDRLVMLLTDSASIRDVLLFPTMKPLD